MILEYSDIKQFLPQLIADIRKSVEKEKFLSYPEGMQKHLCDGRVDNASYQKVYKLWSKPGFPGKEKAGIKGVYLSDLKTFLDK